MNCFAHVASGSLIWLMTKKTQPGPVQPQSLLVPPVTEALLRLSSLKEAGRHRKALNSEGNRKKTTGTDMQWTSGRPCLLLPHC